MIYRIPPKGRAVLFAWLGIISSLLAPVFFWQGLFWSMIFCFIVIASFAWLYLWIKNFKLLCENDLIRANYGVIFRTQVNVPRADICWRLCFSTPLLRLAHCEILIFSTGGSLICICPALSSADIESVDI